MLDKDKLIEWLEERERETYEDGKKKDDNFSFGESSAFQTVSLSIESGQFDIKDGVK